jgi:flagellar protein FlgJ
MSDITIPSVLSTGAGATTKSRAPEKVRDAAQQFEALLLGQILRTERQSGSGWLGSGEDSSAECATDYAEQQFAAVLAQQGGLGLADVIAKGLERNH